MTEEFHNQKDWNAYFKLTTKRVALLGLLVALNLVLSLFSVYVFGLVPMFGFLRIEISFVVYIVAWKTLNEFYAIILIFACSWLRFAGIDPNAEWVGVMTMNLCDLFAFIIFILLAYLFKQRKIEKINSSNIIWIILITIIVITATSLFSVLLNFSFVLKLYNAEHYKSWWYAGALIGFNCLKYIINLIMFWLILRPVDLISKNYTF